MLFAITVACSDQNLDFDNGPSSKRNTDEQDDIIFDDTSIPIDSEPSQEDDEIEDDEIEDDGIVDVDDIMDIFEKYSCQGCHGSSGGFRLNTNELKNGTSTATGLPYIVSGQPQQSYLYAKITDSGGISGQPMPIGGVGLMQDDDIEIVRQWIADGTLGL